MKMCVLDSPRGGGEMCHGDRGTRANHPRVSTAHSAIALVSAVVPEDDIVLVPFPGA